MALRYHPGLVVEEVLGMRQIITGLLRRMGVAHLFEADQGVEALTRLRQPPVDLVLADGSLPQRDGVAFLPALRANPQWGIASCLMITAKASREHVMAARASGVDGALLTPSPRETCVAHVMEIVWREQGQRHPGRGEPA
jgi:two-component system chemotaxis response regulator CheY